MRRLDLFEALQSQLERIPLEQRGNATIDYTLQRREISKSIERQYLDALGRVSELSFVLEWALHFQHRPSSRPARPPGAEDEPPVLLHDIERLSVKLLRQLNDKAATWIVHHIVRDLTEDFGLYLLGMFEICLLIEHASQPLTPRAVADGRSAANQFDDASLRDRLSTLRRRFELQTPYADELLSLNKLRNVMTHNDGYVERRRCGKSGKLTVKWPVNSYRLRDRRTRKWVDYADVPKPYTGDQYDQLQIVFLKKARVEHYRPGARVEVSIKDLNQLIFFYIHVLTEFQEELVEFAKRHEMRARPVSRYVPELALVAVSEDSS